MATESVFEKLNDAIKKHRFEFLGYRPHYIFISYADYHKLGIEFGEMYFLHSSLFIRTIDNKLWYEIEGVKIMSSGHIKDSEFIFGYSDIERLKKLR